MQIYKYDHKTIPLVIRELFDDYTHIHQHNIRQKDYFRHPNINIISSYVLFKCYLKHSLLYNDIT